MSKKIGCVIILLIFLSVAGSLLAQPGFIGINCGSEEPYETFFGEEYLPDHPYSHAAGHGYTGGDTIHPYSQDIHYDTEGAIPLIRNMREGEFSYRFDLEPGWYIIKLRLQEAVYHGSGFRSFSVATGGDTLIRDLDIFSGIGKAYGLIYRFLAECDDGSLEIDFIPVTGEATCCAVGIQAVEEDESPPEDIDGIDVIGGYRMNILYWSWNSAADLKGFRIDRRENNGQWEQITSSPHPINRYRDYDVETGSLYRYRVTAVDVWNNCSGACETSTVRTLDHDESDLPVYEIDIDEELLYRMNIDIQSDIYREMDVTLDGRRYNTSGLRYRGGATRPHAKKNYRILLPEGETYRGERRLNLMSKMLDMTLLHEYLASECYKWVDCHAPRFGYVHLVLNQEFMGVYSDMEPMKNPFLMSRGLSPEGNLYKAYSNLQPLPNETQYRWGYEKENNEDTGWDDIIEFIEWLDTGSDEEFAEDIPDRIELDEFLDFFMVAIAITNLDFGSVNYCIYHNPVTERWHFFPNDNDYTFFTPRFPIDCYTRANPCPGNGRVNVLFDRVLSVPLFKYAYARKLKRYIEQHFTEESLGQVIDEGYDLIEFDVIRDVHKREHERYTYFQGGPERRHSFVEERREYVLDTIPHFIPEIDLAPLFRLNEIQPVNAGTIEDESGDYDPWIEIVNLAPVELDLQSFTLRWGDESWSLPGEAVVDENGFLVLWLDGEPDEGALHADFNYRRDGNSLRLVSPDGTEADAVNPPQLDADEVWARDEDGGGNWSDDLSPTPGSTNTPVWDAGSLVINEFLAINENVNRDEAGEYDDWVEIFNPAPVTLNLQGLYLTDDLEEPSRWSLPEAAIQPGAFLLIWCDGDTDQGTFHAPFRLGGDGEHIGLFGSDGHTPIDMVLFYEQEADVSQGRYPDGSENWGSMTPTPGQANDPVNAVRESPRDVELPAEFHLEPVAPNPFNHITKLRFTLPADSKVKLTAYDLLGRRVAVLVNDNLHAGRHIAIFDGKGLASGIYFCRLEAEKHSITRKMVLLR